MTSSSWTSRAAPARPASRDTTHAAPLFIAEGASGGQQPDEKALYQRLQQKEAAINDLLSKVTTDIKGVVILPFTRGDAEPDEELSSQHSFAQILILTSLPRYDKRMLDLEEGLRSIITDGHVHITNVPRALPSKHYMAPDGIALMNEEQQTQVTRFMTKHLTPAAAESTGYGIPL